MKQKVTCEKVDGKKTLKELKNVRIHKNVVPTSAIRM